MTQLFRVHPEHPQIRRIRQAVEAVRADGVIAYPTDSTYALGCRIGARAPMEQIKRIRGLDDKHDFTLMVRDLKEVSTYVRVGNAAFRLLKGHTPGPYTFILEGTKEVPRRLLHPKRRTVGIRIPAHPVVQALLTELDEPMLTTSAIAAGAEEAFGDGEALAEGLRKQLDIVLDAGPCGLTPTTVVLLTEDQPRVVRVGLGDPAPFE